MKDEINSLKESISTLSSRIDRLEKENEIFCNNLQDNLQKQASQNHEIEHLKRSLETMATELPSQIFEEFEKRHNRRTNIIVRGLPELQSGSLVERKDHDKAKIRELMLFLSEDQSLVSNISRIGRLRSDGHRLVKITVANENTKWNMLQAAKRLKNSPVFAKVYLSPDLTPQQQQNQRYLQLQLKKRREEGEDVVIRSGRIQSRSQFQNFQ